MTSSKITLYGHITYDNIFNGKYALNTDNLLFELNTSDI